MTAHRGNRRRQGFTIIELLIALAVIGIAFAALAFTQVSSLRSTTTSRVASETKTVATNVLESKVSKVLTVASSGAAQYDDVSSGYKSFYFIDYYYSCPTVVTPPVGTRGHNADNLRPSSEISCSGTEAPVTVQDGTVTPTWTIAGESGPEGEGVIDITVSAKHSSGTTVVVSDRLSCYDVYPSPKVDAPAPCPVPTVGGGGR
ncbi:MAG: type II secretion system protein [Deinococcales bacterium]|jgi:prepilin-type N-terminal cleavage/methylation domain-containing protein